MEHRLKQAAKQKNMKPIAPIRTKLSPAQTTAKPMARPRLRFRRQDLKAHQIITITAPAGYGKSTLLAQWHHDLKPSSFSLAWLNLDIEDNEATRFFEYLTASLQKIKPEIGQKSMDALLAGPVSDLSPLMLTLVNDVEKSKEKICLFIDDFHLLKNEECLSLYHLMIKNLPKNLKVIIASRIKIPFPSPYLKLNQQVKEFEIHDLCFSKKEIETYLFQHQGIQLNKTTLKLLIQRTDGWAVVLQLISGLILREKNSESIIQHFSGKDRDLVDYLWNATIEDLPSDLKEFMIHISVAERLCAELCDFLTKRKNSQALLEELEKRNLFLIPLDRRRKWFRFHHLFKDFLMGQLERLYPHQRQVLFRRTGQWFLKKGDQNEAIHFLLLGEHFQIAAKIISDYALELIQFKGEHTTLIYWVENFPKKILKQYPEIRIAYAMSLAFTLQYQKCLKELKAIIKDYHLDTNLENQIPTAQQMSLNASIDLIKVLLAAFADQLQKWKNLSLQWIQKYQRLEVTPIGLGFTYTTLCAASIVTYEFDLGRAAYTKAIQNFYQHKNYFGIAWAHAVFGLMLVQGGHLVESNELYQKAITDTTRHFGKKNFLVLMLQLQKTEVSYEMGLINKKDLPLNFDFNLLKLQGAIGTTLSAYLTAARILFFISQQKTQAIKLLKEGEALSLERNWVRLGFLLLAERIRLEIKTKNMKKAQTLAKQLFQHKPLVTKGLIELFEETCQLTQAQILIAQARYQKAAQILQLLLKTAQRQTRLGLVIQILLLLANIEYQENNIKQCHHFLLTALEFCAPEKFIMRIVEEATPIKKLLAPLIDQKLQQNNSGNSKKYFHHLAKALNIERQLNNPIEPPIFIENFSNREKEILASLNTESSNQDLAKALCISEGTLKWHLNKIYSKLGVNRRVAAVFRARELGIIDT